MSRTIPSGAGGRNRAAQGAVLKYSERLDDASFNLVNSTGKSMYMVNNAAQLCRTVILTKEPRGSRLISQSKRDFVPTGSVGSMSRFG